MTREKVFPSGVESYSLLFVIESLIKIDYDNLTRSLSFELMKKC